MDAKHSLGEPRVLILRQALLHNASVIRGALDPSTRICAILKADAYGHGADIVADTLCNFTANGSLRPAVDMVAVASLDEAAALPELALPVIIFRPLENIFIGRQRQKVEEAIRSGWTMTVCTPSAADDLARIAMTTSSRASVQVMVDTGMTRCGVLTSHVDEVLQKITLRPSLRLAGVCTHFANAEDMRRSVHPRAAFGVPSRHGRFRRKIARPNPKARRQFRRRLFSSRYAFRHGSSRLGAVRNRSGRKALPRSPAQAGAEMDCPIDIDQDRP